MTWPTMSALSLLPHCRWLYRPEVKWPFEKTSASANSGKKLHKMAEAYILGVRGPDPAKLTDEEYRKWGHLADWIEDNKTDSWRPEVKLAWRWEDDTARILTAKGERNYADPRPGEIAGTADVIDFATGEVLDWKTGAERDESAQLATLTHAAELATGHRSANGGAAVYVGTSGVRVTPYARTAWASDARALLATIPHAQPTSGDHCDALYCKARKVCPAYGNPKWKPAPFSQFLNITAKPNPKEPQMSRLANLVKGKFEAPLWDVITGPEGVGKSSFAAGYPSPVWLSLDRGTSHLNIQRMPEPKTWQDILESVHELATEKHDFKTLVIDPINFAEALCWDYVCKRDGKPSIEDYGYGRGYQVALVEWRNLVKKLDALRQDRGMNIVLVAHTAVKRQKSPDAEDFERYALAMHETAAALFRQQADHVLFARIPVTTEKVSPGRFKGRSSNQRELRTCWSPAWDAKARPALIDPLPLNYAAYDAARKEAGSKLDTLKAELEALLATFADDTVAKARAYLLEDPDSISRYEMTIAALNEKQKEAV